MELQEIEVERNGAQPKKKRKTAKLDKEYGVARGIDFKNVACVINFDLCVFYPKWIHVQELTTYSPTSAKSYEHRIGNHEDKSFFCQGTDLLPGRTARADNTGMALSFVIPKNKFRGHKPTSFELCENDEEVLAKITESQQSKGREVLPYNFDMKRLVSSAIEIPLLLTNDEIHRKVFGIVLLTLCELSPAYLFAKRGQKNYGRRS
jgi:ATP-dependent RNA helicase DDX56/DBP9